MLAIHSSIAGFHPRWIGYCKERGVPYKIVDCYRNDIIEQLLDCDALMWHFHQSNVKDILFAKQLLFSVEAMGKKVFPDFNTAWHFDDKVGQKYLLEGLKLKLVPSFVFYDRADALQWAAKTTFPKVFKLRGGAGSQNVRMVEDFEEAKVLIQKAFTKGFSRYDACGNLKERFRKYRLGKTDLQNVIKGVIRLINPPKFSTFMGRERGYVYFQNFIPDNKYDIRVVVVSDKAFAIKRIVRDNDFRASGSGLIYYDKQNFSEQVIQLSFEAATVLKSQCLAIDFVRQDDEWLIVEISYGFVPSGYDACAGYWDRRLQFYEGSFNPYGWMVDDMLK